MNAIAIFSRAALILSLTSCLMACGESFSSISGASDNSSASGENTGVVTSSTNEEDSLPSEGLVLHLETDYGVSEYSNIVTDWIDQSGQGNSVTSVGEPRLVPGELNEFAAIEFDGIYSKFERVANVDLPEGNSNRTLIMLVNYPEGGLGGVGYGQAQCNASFQTMVQQSGLPMINSWCDANVSTATESLDEGWNIHAVVLQDSVVRQYKNNVLIDTQNRSFETIANELVIGGRVGNSGFQRMKIAAALMWDYALDEEQLSASHNYLDQKYLEQPAIASPEPQLPVAAQPTIELPISAPTPPAAPAPDPAPAPAPTPVLTPQPAQEPSPAPDPVPDPAPAPDPAPTPDPEPAPAPDPEPVPEPDPEPVATPTVQLESTNLIGGGIDLSWDVSDADTCTASGSWSGSRAVSGTVRLLSAKIGDTYQLQCSSGGRTGLAMISIRTQDVGVVWEPPAAPTDGSEPTTITSYRLRYGTSSGSYENLHEVEGDRTTTTLGVGEEIYYLTITSVDSAGLESAPSAEVAFRIQ